MGGWGGILDCKCWGNLLTSSSGALWQQGEKEGELAVTSPSPLLSPTPISPVTPGELARRLVLGLIERFMKGYFSIQGFFGGRQIWQVFLSPELSRAFGGIQNNK